MNRTFKKGLALLTTLVMCFSLLCATWIAAGAAESEAPAMNKADFNTIKTSNANGDSKYTNTYTTTNGWTITNSAIQTGGKSDMNPQFTVIGPDNTHKAVCMNGKVSAPGKITSPTLTDGISKIAIKYTKMFTDTKLAATITVTDLATGTKYTQTLAKEAEKNDKYTVWEFEWVLETPVSGDFTIEMVNDCPSGNTGNKDRLTVLELAWESAPKCQHTNTTVEGAVDATCTADGHTGKTVCADCGETVSEGEVIGALGHNEVTDAGKDATCTETGLTEGKHCDRCGETLVAQEEIPALGHADENKDGLCDNCGVQCGEAVPPTGNNAILWTAVSFLLLSAAAIVMTMKKRQVA